MGKLLQTPECGSLISKAVLDRREDKKLTLAAVQHDGESDVDGDGEPGSIQDAFKANNSIREYSQGKLAKQNLVFSHPPQTIK